MGELVSFEGSDDENTPVVFGVCSYVGTVEKGHRRRRHSENDLSRTTGRTDARAHTYQPTTPLPS